jgi:hypothetical protein
MSQESSLKARLVDLFSYSPRCLEGVFAKVRLQHLA